jgi:tungstate transport system ATP-binding protein
MTLLKVTGLGYSYEGRYVLRDIGFEVERGEVLALIGPTGAGKTTLIRLLDLLMSPVMGQIEFEGLEATLSQRSMLKARRKMALVQQRPIVFSMSVFDNVACGLRWRHEKKAVVSQKVEEALELVDMVAHKSRDARELSGGEMQRVALARALVTDPVLLFLDEPTANLDPVSVSRIEEVLLRIISDQKTTVIMTTHDMRQGYRLATKIGVLIDGKLLQVGEPNEVFYSPKSREVAELVGIESILTGVITEKDGSLTTVDVQGKTLQAISELSVDDRVDVLVRPEDITFTLSRDPSSARNVFRGEIVRMNSEGSLIRIVVDCGFPLLGILTVNSAQELDLDIGKTIFANFKATAIHLIKRPN